MAEGCRRHDAADTCKVLRVEVSGSPASVADVKAATKTVAVPSGAGGDLTVSVAPGSADAAILEAADGLSICHAIPTGSRYIDADGEVHNFRSGKSTYGLITRQ